MQGHRVVVVGVGGRWGRELPGLVVDDEKRGKEKESGRGGGEDGARMKIAWRYERLGQFEKEGGGGGNSARGGFSLFGLIANDSLVHVAEAYDNTIWCPDSVV